MDAFHFASDLTHLFFVLDLLLFLTLAVFLALNLWKGKDGQDKSANLALALVASCFMLIVTVAEPDLRVKLLVGQVPAILVLYQAFFLWLSQPKEFKKTQYSKETWETSLLADSRQRAVSTVNSNFGVRTLFIRYAVPAFLLGITGFVVLSVAIDPSTFTNLIRNPAAALLPKIVLGIKMGAVGAYTYVLLELGRRTFRHDITGASALWCVVTLVLGPVLSASVALLWHIEAPQNGDWWAGGVVLFFTGFAPRRVMAAIEQAAIQLLKIGGTGGVVENRLIALNRIRGISPQIEERLSEEGIIDVNSLAQAEPIRLVRNTSFDMRQILAWIDEAILIETLPRSWEVLEDEGITGAIDLAWYSQQHVVSSTGTIDPVSISGAVTDLAQKANLEPISLASVIQRLSEDSQVKYIWALYNSFTEFGGGSESATEPTAFELAGKTEP